MTTEKFMELVEDRHLPYIGYLPHDFNMTGSWRYVHPLRQEKAAPCKIGCGLKSDVPKWIEKIKLDDYAGAWQIIQNFNPFPIITGYVCYHPCESNCNRKSWDEPLSIQLMEKAIGLWKLENEKRLRLRPPQQDKKVAIIGSGPAGLSCAYYLRTYGYSVTIYEKLAVPGGMLAVGIPDYRFPREILKKEIAFLEKFGVEIKTNVSIGESIALEELQRQYDALFLAVGAHKGVKPSIAGMDKKGVFEAIDFLRAVNLGEKVTMKGKVAVIGGGNTAIDAARMAKRLGAKEVTILYRRSKEEMPAHEEEIDAVLSEKIQIMTQVLPKAILGDKKVETIELVKTRTKGREKPVVIVKDSHFNFEAGTVITATGQTGDLEPFGPFLRSERGMVVTDESRIVTDHPGLFAGGDVVTGPATVTEAIYWGRRAAEAIRFYLEGQSKERVSQNLLDQYSEEKREKETSVSFEDLNLNHFGKHPRFLNRANHSSENIRMESERCFSCGTCNQCGICWIFCPDMSIIETERGYEIDYDYCKGCGICAYECPRAIIRIVEGKGGKGVSIK